MDTRLYFGNGAIVDRHLRRLSLKHEAMAYSSIWRESATFPSRSLCPKKPIPEPAPRPCRYWIYPLMTI